MKMVEYVPTITPNRIANTNPRIVSPPKMNIASNTMNVDNEVEKVRLNVEHIDSLI